jgi:MFS family permease
MFGRAVRAEERPHVISTRNVLVGISGIAVAFFGGKFLELVEFPYNYSILFSVSFAASLLSNYYLGRIRLPATEPPHEASPITQARSARQVITMLRANQRYVYFALSQFVFHWGVFFAVPLYSIYWVRNLGVGESWVGIYRMVESAASIIAFPLWARFTSRRGNRRTLFVSSVGMTFYTIFTPLSPAPEWIAYLSVLGGASSAGFSLALFNELLHVSPEQDRPIFAAVFNTIINFSAFVSPLVATSLIPFFGIHAMLFAAAGFRLLGVFSIWRNIARQSTG